jgi:hypothetical protein
MALRTYPYSFHVALDGSGLNGLEGRAGVCVFRCSDQVLLVLV